MNVYTSTYEILVDRRNNKPLVVNEPTKTIPKLNKRILLADDNVVNSMVAKKLLELFGYSEEIEL